MKKSFYCFSTFIPFRISYHSTAADGDDFLYILGAWSNSQTRRDVARLDLRTK